MELAASIYFLSTVLSLFCFQTKILFLKSEERVEKKVIMSCKPSSVKTINLLTKKQNKRHDEEMNEVKEQLIKNKLKQPTPW